MTWETYTSTTARLVFRMAVGLVESATSEAVAKRRMRRTGNFPLAAHNAGRPDLGPWQGAESEP